MTVNQKYFNTGDYIVFSIMILLPFFIGVYFAFFAKKKTTTVSEYLVGNRNMSVFPVSMSFAASMISATSLIGPVSEIYFYGVIYLWLDVAKLLASFFGANVFIPVFHNLKLTSMYEYLGIRFNYKLRILGTILFVIQIILFGTILIHLPALLFEHMMGIPYGILVPVVSAVCIFYTSFGGIFAVVWTDTFQMTVMLVGMFIFAVVGVYNVGDLRKFWEINEKGGRINFFNMDPNPLLRHTFWTMFVGGFFNVVAMVSTSQAMVQRSASLSSLKKINIATLIYVTVAFTLKLSAIIIGFSIYANFHECDPLTSSRISKPDQLLAFFMMHLKDQIPLLPSILVSAVFCASLSTISTGLNSVAGVILIDIIKPFSKKPISDSTGALMMKIMVIVGGIITTGLAFTIEQTAGLVQTGISLTAMTIGTTLGVFTLGVLFPWANSTGSLIGMIISSAFVGWITVGTQVAIQNKQIVNVKLPLSIENCDNVTMNNYYKYLNSIALNATKSTPGEPFPLYKISYMYFGLIGTVTTIIIGMIASYFIGFNNPNDMDPKLFSPIIQGYLRRKRGEEERKEIIEAVSTL